MIPFRTAWHSPTARYPMAFDQGYADTLAEVEMLHQDLATSEAACASAIAEVEALKADLAKAVKRRVGEHDEPCPHDSPAPTWQGGKCVKPRGHVVWTGREVDRG